MYMNKLILDAIQSDKDKLLLFSSSNFDEIISTWKKITIDSHYRSNEPYWNLFYRRHHNCHYIYLMKTSTASSLMKTTDDWDDPITMLKYSP